MIFQEWFALYFLISSFVERVEEDAIALIQNDRIFIKTELERRSHKNYPLIGGRCNLDITDALNR